MGEECEMTLFVGEQQVTMESVDLQPKEETTDKWVNNMHYEWSATIEGKTAVKAIVDALGIKADRTYTRQERKRFIRTVEHYGCVEFTLHDYEASVDGLGWGKICLLCPTPKSVKMVLRMRELGKVTYKIRKRWQ